MTKERTYIFYSNSGDDSKDWSTLTRSDGSHSQSRLIAQHFDCTPDGKAPEIGYRLTERNPEGTHTRMAPWVVESAESYVPDLPVGTLFTEVVICQCEYTPLPEDENPWTEIVYGNQVTFEDSFGGDRELFAKFLESEAVGNYEIIGPVPSEFREKVEALQGATA